MKAVFLSLALWRLVCLCTVAAVSLQRTGQSGSDFDPIRGLNYRSVPAPEPDVAPGTYNRPQLLSTVHNTAVYVASGGITGYKFALLSRLASSSPYHIVVGYHIHGESSIPAAQLDTLRVALTTSKRGSTIVPTSYDRLQQKYGTKISDYLGRNQENPAKLAVMDWFNSSSLSFMWHLEDDVWAPGLNQLTSEWVSSRADLIIKTLPNLPFWAVGKSTWRVSARDKVPDETYGTFLHCNPAVFRMSKRFAESVLETIEESETTNHHELWFPYVVKKSHLTWSELTHTEKLHLNPYAKESLYHMTCLSGVRHAPDVVIAHPIKCA